MKLDRTTVDRHRASTPPARRSCSTLVTFADDHGCEVIAEGVETEAERDALRDAGVHLGQGYFVGRPVPVDRCSPTSPPNITPGR